MGKGPKGPGVRMKANGLPSMSSGGNAANSLVPDANTIHHRRAFSDYGSPPQDNGQTHHTVGDADGTRVSWNTDQQGNVTGVHGSPLDRSPSERRKG
jgi:hypothetical protein